MSVQQHPDPGQGRSVWARVALACLLLLAMLTWGACFLARNEPASLAAPLLGPWAGLVYGHLDCTMASVLPLASGGALVLGLGALVTLLRQRCRRTSGLVLAMSWANIWAVLALLSVINSTS